GPDVIARVLTIRDYERDQSATGRLEAWKAGLAIMLDSPILGVGPDSFRHYSALYNPDAREGIVAHNEFIETAAESGIPAGLTLLAIIALAFHNLYRVRKLAAQAQNAEGA